MSAANEKKSGLRKAVIKLLETNNVGWFNQTVDTLGKVFVNTVTSCMWYLDGKHVTLSSRGCGIPEELKHLSGFNMPELSHHRPVDPMNFSKNILEEHSVSFTESN